MPQAGEDVCCVGKIVLVMVTIKVYAAQPTVRGDSHAVTHLATWKDMAMAFWPLQRPSGPGRQSQHKRAHFATNVTKARRPVTDGSRI